MNLVTTPFQIFYDTDGSPLNNGYIYIGTENLNPETNPVSLYWDIAGTIPAANPLRTINGFIVNNGSASNVFVGNNYSQTIRNSSGSFVSFIPSNALGSDSGSLNNLTEPLNFKNKIINGDFKLDRLNLSAAVTPVGNTNLADNYYATLSVASKLTFQQITSNTFPSFKNSYKITVASQYNPQVSDQFLISQNLVGRNLDDFGCGTSTPATIQISLEVKASVAGTYSCSLSNAAGNRCYVGTITVIAANVAQFCTVTLTCDNTGTWLQDTGVGLVFSIDLGCGTNANTTSGSWQSGAYKRTIGSVIFVNQTANSTFEFTGLMIQRVSETIDYEHKPYEIEQLLVDGIQLLQLGQCRLIKSGANLLLSPLNGNKILINGVQQVIPSAGVQLVPPATTLILYYIYVYMNSGTMTLEASTTGHSTDTTTGVEVKTGDATRTLVGMARTVSSAWVDTITQRFVRSWFNRITAHMFKSFSNNRFTTSGAFVEIDPEIRNEFLIWADEGVSTSIQGTTSNSNVSAYDLTTVGWDGTADVNTSNSCGGGGAGVYYNCSMVCTKTGLAEGYHYVTLMGVVTGGTGYWSGAIAGIYTSLSTVVR